MTGVTGFVGAFLLDAVLQLAHARDCRIVCLVRAPNDDAATERVRSSLHQYRLQCDAARWTAVAGDLAEEHFGLTTARWDQLIASVQVVYHAGAIVNAALPLAAIRAANIGGTKTVVEMCVAAGARLHHISTASVLAGSNITEESFVVPPPRKRATAYAKSKWISEQIVGHGVVELGLSVLLN
jgi:thioester reductase-like protein